METSSESESRRPTWKPGVAVVLANGETWHVPRVKAGPIEFIRDGHVELCAVANGRRTPEVAEAWFWFHKTITDASLFPHFAHIPNESAGHNLAGVWAAMLRVNYDVSWLEAFWLVRYGFEARYELATFATVTKTLNSLIDMESMSRLIATIPRSPEDN
jgi:hypothetical protein